MAKLNNFIALDISDNSLEIMECQRDFWGRYVIKSINRLALDKGVIVDGDIKNANALVKSLKKLLQSAKPSPISSSNCLLSIPENKVFTHIFHVPLELKNDDIEDFLLNQSEGIIPFNRETIISDYNIVETSDREKTILYVAAPRKLIDDVLAVLKKVKLNVLLIELESLSVARALLTKPYIKDANVIMDMGGNFSNITIYDNQGLKLTVSLPLAGNQFTKEIHAKAKLTIAESSEIKIKEGLNSPNKNVVLALQSSLAKIIEEITRSVSYFEKKSGQTVKRLLLVGGSAKLPGIVDYLASKIKLEIIPGNPWYRLKKTAEVLKVFKKSQGIMYSTVIGLLLRGKQSDYRQGINLLPSNVRKHSMIQLSSGNKGEWVKYVILSVIVIAFVLLLVFQNVLRGDRQIATVSTFNIEEKKVALVVSYNEEESTDISLSRIKGSIVDQSGSIEEVWTGVTTDQLTILADDYLIIYNNSAEGITLVANSRLSAGGDIYYLVEPLNLAASTNEVVQVIRNDDIPVKLEEGVYKFIALPDEKQDLIYGEKKYELDNIPPEQISRVDITSMIELQDLMRKESMNNSYNQLPEGYYIDQPLSMTIKGLKYIRMDDKQIGLRLIVDYKWIMVLFADILDISLNKIGDNITSEELKKADLQILKQNMNDTEKTIGIELIWTIPDKYQL